MEKKIKKKEDSHVIAFKSSSSEFLMVALSRNFVKYLKLHQGKKKNGRRDDS